MIRLGLAVLWLLRLLPLRVLAGIGNLSGLAAYRLAADRRRIAYINLTACFPAMPKQEIKAIVRRHFQCITRAALEEGILWWSRRERLLRLIRLEGLEHWLSVQGRPVILFVPHFVGLDMGGIRINAEYPLMTIYSKQKDPRADAIVLLRRNRFGAGTLYSRQDGLRPILKALRKVPLYYLPDQDFGPRDAIFVPFFGIPAATITGLARIAKLTGAKVVPCVTRQLPGGAGYVTRFYPPWDDYPTADLVADTRRMNEFLEARIVEMPEQYFWTHKRFKTRPPGEAHWYDKVAKTEIDSAARSENV
jgi:Kdo2-lipid IVA lauroyltransferase/acyltransferase